MKRSLNIVGGLTNGACRLNLKSKKKSPDYQINQSIRKFSKKKFLKSENEPKMCMRAHKWSLQAQPKIKKE
jgi:hypothetical protein